MGSVDSSTQAKSGLEWAAHLFGWIPADSIQNQTPGSSTPQITAVAVICCGRNDRVGEMGTGLSSKNKNAGLVGPAASLLLICGERLVYVSGPRGSFNCLGPHRYGPLRALLTGREPN